MLMTNVRYIAPISVLLLLCFATPAHAADATTDFALLADSGNYVWEEFRPRGTRIVEETGKQVGVGASWSNGRNPVGGGPVYRATALVFGGVGDYQGETYVSAGLPVSATTYFYGIKSEGIGGYRFGNRIGFELFSGIGFDVWNHTVKDAGATLGYSRMFAMLDGKLGAGFFMGFESWGFAVRAGTRGPLYSYQHVGIYDGVEVKTVPKPTFFGAGEFTFGSHGHDTFVLSFYFDRYRLAESDPTVVNSGGVPSGLVITTPYTKTTLMGARLALNF